MPWPWVRRVGAPAPEGPPPQWPLRLQGRTPGGELVVLRPLAHGDAERYAAVRRTNAEWLAPWDATAPDRREPGRTFGQLVEHYEHEARAGRMLPFALEVGGLLVGQVNLASVTWGSFRSCAAGYWVSRSVAGRGVVPTALAVAGDHALAVLGLHRIEVNIRPENVASLAVVRKLGFRAEGLRPHLLHIDGAWRDHLSFALTTEDLGGESLTERLGRLSQQPHPRHTVTGP
ncbi:MAG TPA: GNAT family protein [Dermatophilaceae bacterium]|nr:GNAT family protein [Dermatophilaceae bacterium]